MYYFRSDIYISWSSSYISTNNCLWFRIFERRMGSQKFASHLLATSLVSLLLEVTCVLVIKALGWDSYHSGHLPPGP